MHQYYFFLIGGISIEIVFKYKNKYLENITL